MAQLADYREAIKRLTQHSTGLCLDRNCRHCGYPELSIQVKWPEDDKTGVTPLGVAVCRKCGHAELTALPTPKEQDEHEHNRALG